MLSIARLSLDIADYAYVLDNGAVAYAGPASELAADKSRVQALAGASAEKWKIA
jgi:branched-chain amino acid transport system ATP-binding protein